MPEPSVSAEGRIVQVDVFEAAEVVPMISVREAGALFAASTRSAEPSRHPRAAIYIERMTSRPGYPVGGEVRDDGSVLRIEQSPGGSVRIVEHEARQLLAWLATLDQIAERATPGRVSVAATEIRLDGFRMAYTPRDPDVVRLRTGKFEAIYVRKGFAAALKTALFKIDSLRREATTTP